MNKFIKQILEFGPLIAFLISYKTLGMIPATLVLVVASIIAMGITYFIERKVPFMLLFSTVIVTLFGGMTVYSGNADFIKMKPTILNILFSAILAIGYLKGNGLIKYVFGKNINLSEENWQKISIRYAVFFIIMAMINEIVWRNFAEDIWVIFKVFGYLGLTLGFTLSQIPFIVKNQIDSSKT